MCMCVWQNQYCHSVFTEGSGTLRDSGVFSMIKFQIMAVTPPQTPNSVLSSFPHCCLLQDTNNTGHYSGFMILFLRSTPGKTAGWRESHCTHLLDINIKHGVVASPYSGCTGIVTHAF